ncbi:Immunoglobulin I-set domain [Nesidiocoris tenuis]|uniref:Immunoglobulin I-set domain n=1 Tax=Nesidiocoris tenuis TaxID=355587 RepID=A0ABN7AG51_9HEMI|nr:Immunoglobulin I-set domain [Nesidiocoris tenuis]
MALVHLRCVTLASLILCIAVNFIDGAEDVSIVPEYDFSNIRVLDYKATNTLKCNVSGNLKAAGLHVAWLKNDMNIENEPKKYHLSNNKLTIHRTTEEDLQTYTCVLVQGNNFLHRRDIQTWGKPTAKINSQGTFIQGQKITLECVTQGKPTPKIVWRFGNETFTASSGRIKLLENDKKVPGAILQIDSAEMSDRGHYYCQVSNKASIDLNITIETSAYIRVKDKLAALWPFIGICAEVLVLCVIIFVYERKRNKQELEESDTDISPDQKNTPDHGKDSVRQRK